MFCKKGVPQACNFIRKETLAQAFSCEFFEISKNIFSLRTSQVAKRVRGSKCRRTKTVDKDILITYRFKDRRFSQPIIRTSHLPQEQGIRKNSASSLSQTIDKWMRIKSLSKTVCWNEIHRRFLHLTWPYHFIW